MAGISTLDAANRFLADSWVRSGTSASWSSPRMPSPRTGPRRPASTWRPCLPRRKPGRCPCDFIIRFKNRHWQIPEREARGVRPGDEIVVERRLCGDIHFRIGQRYLAVESLGRGPSPDKTDEGSAREAPKAGVEAAGARTGPWRKQIHASARMAMARRDKRLAEEAARSNGKPAEPPDAVLCRASLMGGNLVGLWRRARHGPRLAAPHRPGKGGCDPAQRDRGQPPDLRAGQARPSDRGVHYPPHPLPAQAGRGWKTLTQGGTFLFRSTPGHFHSGLTPRTPSQLATTMKNDYSEQITRTSLSGSRPPDVYTLFAPTSSIRRESTPPPPSPPPATRGALTDDRAG